MPRIGLRLTKEQHREIMVALRKARSNDDLDLSLRIQALLLVNRGIREREVAQLIGVGRRTLQEWIHRYRSGGVSRLKKGPFKGGHPKLSEEQKAELARIIQAGPKKAGLDTKVWSASIVTKLVKDRFGVSYHPAHMSRILHSLGCSVGHPQQESSNSGEKRRKTWILTPRQEDKKKPKKKKGGA